MRVNNERQDLNAINDGGKAPVSPGNDPSILDDLFLTAETESNIKAGCLGCVGGPPVINHNETTVSDDEVEAQLTDLGPADEELDGIKGGPDGTRPGGDDGGGGRSGGDWVINHNETTLSDEQAATEALDDLTVEGGEQVKGGTFSGQTVRLRIATTQNEGQL